MFILNVFHYLNEDDEHICFLFYLPPEPAFDKQLAKDKAERACVKTVEPLPLKRPLPDLRTLGSVPAKPPRPPRVDLSHYQALMDNSMLFLNLCFISLLF